MATADTHRVRVVLEIPGGVNTRAVVSALQAWLCRYGARIDSWTPEKRGPAGLFERTERP